MDPLKIKLEKLGFAAVLESKHQKKLEKFYFEQQDKEPTLPKFIDLMKWLLNLNKIKTNWTNDTDVPKVLEEISSIMKTLKISVPSSALKLGYGQEITNAIQQLCDRVLPRNNKVVYVNDIITVDAVPRQVEYQFTNEQIPEQTIDQLPADLFVPVHTEFNKYAVPNWSSWNREVESINFEDIIPKNHGEWRFHWEQLNGHLLFIKQSLDHLRDPLVALIRSNSDVLEKILAREKHLNESFIGQISEYKVAYESYHVANKSKIAEEENIKTMTQELLEASDQLDKLLKQMDEHGSKITDATPLAEIKNAIIELKNELQQNEIILHVYRQGYLNKSMETVK